MKIFRNIIPGIKICCSLWQLRPYNREITKAKEAGNFEREREYILKSTGQWGNHIVKAFEIDLVVNGRENLPSNGPAVFVGNHQSFADIPVACAVLDNFQFGFVARDNLARVPFYGRWMSRIRGVFINREDARSSLRTIEEGIALLEKGFSLMIFPEGTRSQSASMAEFKKGSLRLATKPGVPVIPVSINGTYHIFEESGYVKKGAHVNLTIHPAIGTKGMSRTDANNLAAKVEAIVRSGL